MILCCSPLLHLIANTSCLYSDNDDDDEDNSTFSAAPMSDLLRALFKVGAADNLSCSDNASAATAAVAAALCDDASPGQLSLAVPLRIGAMSTSVNRHTARCTLLRCFPALLSDPVRRLRPRAQRLRYGPSSGLCVPPSRLSDGHPADSCATYLLDSCLTYLLISASI